MKDLCPVPGPRSVLAAACLLALALVLAIVSCGSRATQNFTVINSGTATVSVTGTGSVTATGSVTGTVTEANSDDRIDGAVVTIQGKSVTTDLSGRFAIEDVPAGTHSIHATADGFFGYTGTVTVTEGGSASAPIFLDPTSDVSGFVRDAQTGAALSGASVTLGTAQVTTDASGYFKFTTVAAGELTMTASSDGYSSGAAMVYLPPSESVTQDFNLYPLPVHTTGNVVGTVTDAISGMQLADVGLSVQGGRATSTSRGDYVINGVPSGTQVLTATLKGYKPWSKTIEVGDQTTITVNVELSHPGTTGTVSGKIEDMNTGEEIPEANVTIGARATTTNKRGDFTLLSVPVGTPTVVVSKKGYLDQSDSVLVQPDSTCPKNLNFSKTPLRKGPYMLYTNDTASMTVQWQTFATPLEAKVDWGDTTAYGHSKIVTENSPAVGEHQFSHTITGLTPGKRTYYQVTVDGQSAAGSFVAAPDPAQTTLSFYGYGDMRTNHARWAGTNEHEEVCNAMLDDMRQDDARQTILLNDGDIVRRGLDASYWDMQYFDRFYPKQLEVEASLPIMGSIGNHECFQNPSTGVDFTDGGTLFRKYWPYPQYPKSNRFFYSFDYGPIHVAVVDTWMYPEYTPGSEQYRWLAQDLHATTKPWKVVLMHTPAYDCDWVDKGLAEGLCPLMKQEGVKLVLAGHAHHYCRSISDGITYLTLGGGGAEVGHPKPPYPSYVVTAAGVHHFARFDVTKDQIVGTIIQSDGKPLETFTIAK